MRLAANGRPGEVGQGHEKAPEQGALPNDGMLESHWSELNRRPLDYESSALPLSYSGNEHRECPGADSNRDALRHHPLKMACLPVSPPGLALPTAVNGLSVDGL